MKLSRWHFGLWGEQSLTMGIPRSVPLASCRGSTWGQEAGVSLVGVIAGSGLGACIHFQKTFVFVRYSFVERVLNIYLWGIRQPVARPRNPSKSPPIRRWTHETVLGYFDSNKLGSKYMARDCDGRTNCRCCRRCFVLVHISSINLKDEVMNAEKRQFEYLIGRRDSLTVPPPIPLPPLFATPMHKHT